MRAPSSGWSRAAVWMAVAAVAACDGTGGTSFGDFGHSISSAFSSDEPPPSPAQQRLRQTAAQYSTGTLLTGCLIGGLVGAGIGAAVNGGKGAAVGAAGGLAVGCLGGHYVASTNQRYANEQIALQSRIEAANKDIQETAQAAADARQVVQQHKAEITKLNEQYRKKQVDAQAYAGQIEAAKRDAEAMKLLIESKDKVLASMQQDIAQRQQQGLATADLINARQRLQAEQNALKTQLGALVAAVDTVPANVAHPPLVS